MCAGLSRSPINPVNFPLYLPQTGSKQGSSYRGLHEEILQTATTIAREAGVLLRDGQAEMNRNRGSGIRYKTSEIDLRSERHITDQLR